jgi:NitT/TauT family transport system ATP-binding protein
VVLAPRPGRVRDQVAINLPRPRDATEPATAGQAHQLKSLI